MINFKYFNCRDKIGRDINFKGKRLSLELTPAHERSFIFVAKAVNIEDFIFEFRNFGRDIDVLEESPGTIINETATNLS